ncbi:unnamed protein product [Symbiodinium sp. KB8]|nr:unnamed protein product [Symbiodinium sp. KB8]
MAFTVPASGRLPRSTAPPEAADKHELKAVLAAQESEMHAMKTQLAEAQRECNRLKHKLRDVETEVQVAKQVTASATDRLTAHAERKDLLLSAGVERGGLERAKLEEELQPLGLKGARDGRSRGILTSCKSSSHTWPMAARGMFTCLGVKPGEWG